MRTPRAAFARAELAVAVVGLVVLAGLLLPAVQRARAAADRDRCADHLRRLGQAVQGYEDARGSLPPRRLRQPVHHGIGAVLLPFVGEEAAARAYRIDLDFYAPENAKVIARPLAVFQSPTAPADRAAVPVTDAGMVSVDRPGAPGDYFTVHSVYDLGVSANVQGTQHAALDDDAGTPRTALTDGSAFTMLLTEQAGRPEHWVAGKKQDGSPNLNGWWGAWPAYNSFNLRTYTADGTKEVRSGGACVLNCNNSLGIYSFCPGGAHVAFADGSVRLVSPAVNRYVLFALVSRDGGEVLSADDF